MRVSSIGRRIALGVVVAAIVFVLYENAFVHKFQECIGANSSAYGENSGNEYAKIIASIISGSRSQLICTVRVLDKHNGFFTALAGVSVAFFTFTLWQSTDKLWRAGRDTFEATERAFVFIDGFNHEMTTADQSDIRDDQFASVVSGPQEYAHHSICSAAEMGKWWQYAD